MKISEIELPEVNLKESLSDQNMERAFITAACLGLGAVVVPFLAPVALTGMIGSQAVFWGKRLSAKAQEHDEDLM